MPKSKISAIRIIILIFFRWKFALFRSDTVNTKYRLTTIERSLADVCMVIFEILNFCRCNGSVFFVGSKASDHSQLDLIPVLVGQMNANFVILVRWIRNFDI